MQATTGEQEQFIEIFSRYLAGHPEKKTCSSISTMNPTAKSSENMVSAGFKLFTAAAAPSK